MDRWEGKIAVVTGASAGIGAAIAEDLVKAGVLVVGLARRATKLEQLAESLGDAKGKLYPRKCDVRKEEDILSAFEWVNAEFGGVDILVNNAGIGNSSKIIEDDIDAARKILEVNVLAMVIAIREAVASMKIRNVPGYIININSILGHAVPQKTVAGSVYGPSKFAVTSLTETVRKELVADPDNKIKITSVSPGLVKTEIIQASGIPGGDNLYNIAPYLDAKDVSSTVLYLLGTRQNVQVTELTIRPLGS